MKSRFVLRVLAAIGILALSATVAQAGDGGKPSALTGFFVCHSINGGSPGHVVDLESPNFGPNRLSVKIGNGTLACFFAKLYSQGELADGVGNLANEVDPNAPTDSTAPPGSAQFGQLKCYTVSVPRKSSDSGKATYDVTDSLWAGVLPLWEDGAAPSKTSGTELAVPASEIRFICGPATFNRSGP